jgi:hypothetical protein
MKMKGRVLNRPGELNPPASGKESMKLSDSSSASGSSPAQPVEAG